MIPIALYFSTVSFLIINSIASCCSFVLTSERLCLQRLMAGLLLVLVLVFLECSAAAPPPAPVLFVIQAGLHLLKKLMVHFLPCVSFINFNTYTVPTVGISFGELTSLGNGLKG